MMQWLFNETKLLSSATLKEEMGGEHRDFKLRIKFLLDESCIHALFVKPKLVFHNFGDRGSINRGVVKMLTTFLHGHMV